MPAHHHGAEPASRARGTGGFDPGGREAADGEASDSTISPSFSGASAVYRLFHGFSDSADVVHCGFMYWRCRKQQEVM